MSDVADAGSRRCLWCRCELPATRLRYCSTRCRQTAWRFRHLTKVEGLADGPKRLVYADPPFPGKARRCYQHEPTYAGEVDHTALIAQLLTYDGWALSTSKAAFITVVHLIPVGIEFSWAPWVKVHKPSPGRGPSNVHEYVIYSSARRMLGRVPDALVAQVARGGDSNLIGRKPIKFVNWMFQLLGALPGDTLDDLFPGSGVVGRCWQQFNETALHATCR